MQKLATLTGTHPVVSLSHGAYHWLHRPFDAQELSYSYSDELGPSV
jgi:DNA-binding response OmpR family regulator